MNTVTAVNGDKHTICHYIEVYLYLSNGFKMAQLCRHVMMQMGDVVKKKMAN